MHNPLVPDDVDDKLLRTPGGGLINPEVKDPVILEPPEGAPKLTVPAPVGEPRWQIIISLIIAAIFVILWLMPFISNLIYQP